MIGPARIALVAAIGLAIAGGAGCRTLTPPPYRGGQAPKSATLIEATTPRLHAIAVPSARIKTNRAARGGLSFIAQAPKRFNGRVHAAGNELATLAFSEEGYALRYLMDGMPQGFYSGPPSACAVQALIGVEFSLDGLVALVLGGGPVIGGPREIVRQRWDRRAAREVLVLRNASFEQELYFVRQQAAWWFSGASLWERAGDGRGAWRWTVEHLDLQARSDAVLPRQTRIATPGKRRDNVVVITYREQNTKPEFARSKPATASPTAPLSDPGGEGEEWGEDEGWEDLDDAAKPDDTSPPEATKTTPSTKPKPAATVNAIPPQFRLRASGLTDRGDLCR